MLSDRKPVENLQHVTCYVAELWYLANKACRRTLNTVKAWGPYIYDVHTEGGSGSGGRMWAGKGGKPHVDVHTEN